MKKSLLYSLAAFAGVMLAGCNGDYDDWANPQINGPEDAVTIPGYTATAAGDIDLAQPGQNVKVFNLSEAALPEGSSLQKTRMVVVPADGSLATNTLSQTLDANEDGTMDSTVLQNLVLDTYGKRPVARSYKARVYSDVINSGQAMLVDAGEISFNITPKAPHISQAYYLAGNMTSWDDASKFAKFSHSDADVYEDPVFTLTITTTAKDQYWKIIPQENINSGDYFGAGALGVEKDGSTDTEGSLVTVNPQAGKLAEAGTYVFSLNMLDYTYSITKVDTYYMVGGVYGWNADAASKLAFFNESGSVASITTQWTGDANLKIWNRDGIGNWDVAWGSVVDGAKDAEGDLINKGANAFVCPEKGAFYTLTIDMVNKKYSWTKLDDQNPQAFTTVSLIGAFNDWNGDVDMEQTAPHNWYVRHTFSNGTEMKFRSNHDWSSANWGGKAKSLAGMIYAEETGGDNLNIAAGTYDIYFNDITGKFLFVEIK